MHELLGLIFIFAWVSLLIGTPIVFMTQALRHSFEWIGFWLCIGLTVLTVRFLLYGT